MLLTLMGLASSGLTYANAAPDAASIESTQQQETCTGIVKDATGETVIGAFVIVYGITNGTILGIFGYLLL